MCDIEGGERGTDLDYDYFIHFGGGGSCTPIVPNAGYFEYFEAKSFIVTTRVTMVSFKDLNFNGLVIV